MPRVTWINVFHFSTYPASVHNGDRIPALFIKNDGHFQICTAINLDYNQCKAFPFDLGKWYRMFIKQYKSCGKYWYEIIIDNRVEIRIENSFPTSYLNVNLYGSDPWTDAMTSDIGNICNVKISGMCTCSNPSPKSKNQFKSSCTQQK